MRLMIRKSKDSPVCERPSVLCQYLPGLRITVDCALAAGTALLAGLEDTAMEIP